MALNKRNIPPVLYSTLETFLNTHYPMIGAKEKEGCIVVLYDTDPSSHFHFTIKKIEKDNVYYNYLPSLNDSNKLSEGGCKIAQIINALNSWAEKVSKYQNPSVFDDIILENYRQEFYNEFCEFKIVDENSDKEPFNWKQQLCLSQYIQNVSKYVEEIKAELEEEDYDNIKVAINNTEFLITKGTKTEVMKGISSIWAATRKSGFKYFQMIVSGFFQSLGEEGGRFVISEVKSLVEKFTPLILA